MFKKNLQVSVEVQKRLQRCQIKSESTVFARKLLLQDINVKRREDEQLKCILRQIIT